MTYRSFFLITTCALTLSACQTWDGLKNDLGALKTTTSEKIATLKRTDNAQSTVIDASVCPAIIIDPQLDSMSEFMDMNETDENNLISRAFITETISECDVNDSTLDMKLELSFKSELGPKARAKDSDQPFFAYPYFISVTDADGQELAKEIFAASITYEKGQNAVELIETINQSLPLNEDGSASAYQIHIGFQLTDEQLFYNASTDK